MQALKRHFLPLGLALAIVIGLAFPAPGAALHTGVVLGLSGPHWAVCLVFLLSGYLLDRAELSLDRSFARALAAAVGINLVMGPALAWTATHAFALDPGQALGLTAMLCAPTTLSSGIVITRQAGGNTAWAIALTALLTLTGVVLMPLTLSASLGTHVAIPGSAARLALTLGGLVLLPLVAGGAARQLAGWKAPEWASLLLSGGVISMVWMSVSRHQAAVASIPFFLLAGSALLAAVSHGILLLAAWSAGHRLGLAPPERLSLAFVASQKTLPLGLTALIALSGSVEPAVMGIATASAVTFHYLQIALDSLAITGGLRHPK